jgi:hypothetical protein
MRCGSIPTLTSTVGGTLHTVVASKEVTSEHRTFRFTWTYNGVSLKLKGFGMIAKPEERHERPISRHHPTRVFLHGHSGIVGRGKPCPASVVG